MHNSYWRRRARDEQGFQLGRTAGPRPHEPVPVSGLSRPPAGLGRLLALALRYLPAKVRKVIALKALRSPTSFLRSTLRFAHCASSFDVHIQAMACHLLEECVIECNLITYFPIRFFKGIHFDVARENNKKNSFFLQSLAHIISAAKISFDSCNLYDVELATEILYKYD